MNLCMSISRCKCEWINLSVYTRCMRMCVGVCESNLTIFVCLSRCTCKWMNLSVRVSISVCTCEWMNLNVYVCFCVCVRVYQPCLARRRARGRAGRRRCPRWRWPSRAAPGFRERSPPPAATASTPDHHITHIYIIPAESATLCTLVKI